ncbi:MAG: hypothetical protein J5603_00195, partial [Bacteroidales bacterium]|nr:hypothetical protein [Bacteroidales bacterium]
YRLNVLVELIENWLKMNDENKFLMSITDEELENYVNSINQSGIALTEKSLIGTWELSSTDENLSEWEFRKDHTYSSVTISSYAVNLPFANGKIKASITEEGTWLLDGDSLIRMSGLDALFVKMDTSNLLVMPGKQDMCDDWVNEYKEQLKQYYQDNIKNNLRTARHARLDASHDKMELKGISITPQGDEIQVTYYLKRKK